MQAVASDAALGSGNDLSPLDALFAGFTNKRLHTEITLFIIFSFWGRQLFDFNYDSFRSTFKISS